METGTVIGIATDDVEAAAKRLKTMGADLITTEPQEFPGGRFIAVRDPAGNVVELLEFGQ